MENQWIKGESKFVYIFYLKNIAKYYINESCWLTGIQVPDHTI